MLFDNLLLTLPFFALLLILSIFSISLTTEKILLFRKWRCRNKNLHSKLSAQLREGQIDEKCIINPKSPEAQLLQKSLHFIQHELAEHKSTQFSYKQGETKHESARLEFWIHNCIEEFSLQMEKHINLFHLIANVATLLGLLGTVTGMIYAFQNGALEQSTQLAQGISQALVTTAGGLVVAIPAIISQQLFQNVIGIRISKLEQLGRDIVFYQQKRPSYRTKLQERLYNINEDATKNILKKGGSSIDLTKLQNRSSLVQSSAKNYPKKKLGKQATQGA